MASTPVETLQLAVPGTSGTPALTAIRPYCGAEITSVLPVEESRLADRGLHGKPVPAWADVGVASHMQGVCNDAGAAPEVLQPRFDGTLFAFRSLVAGASALENLCCWLTYLEIRNPSQNFYNKFEAYSLGVPGLDRALGALSAINTLYLFVFWVLVTVVRLDVYRFLALGRLVLSIGCGVICLVALFFSESTTVFPFLSTLCCLLHAQALVVGALLPRKGRQPNRGRVLLCGGVLTALGVLMLVWCLMYLLDGMAFLREDECRATKNEAMPVRIAGVSRWQCAKWGVPHYITRVPHSGSTVFQAQCSTPFHAFDQVVGTVWTPSEEAHWVQCPPSCQDFGLGVEVLGCRVYDARTPICAAAVQIGVLRAEQGGLVKVVGRKPASSYDRCNLNGVMSVEDASRLQGTALIAARGSTWLAGANASSGTATQQNVTLAGAFYFQGVAGMEEEDILTLHGFRKLGRPGPKQPYRSYAADVSWRIGGGELQRREVVLGPDGDADIELNFCHGGDPAPNDCE